MNYAKSIVSLYACRRKKRFIKHRVQIVELSKKANTFYDIELTRPAMIDLSVINMAVIQTIVNIF